MKREFVKTANTRLFKSTIMAAEARGAKESGGIRVTGRPGEGKTRTLLNWASERGAAMVTAQVDWTPRKMMMALAEKLGVQTTHGFERHMVELIAAREIPLVVDEAGFMLNHNAVCLEKLRGITDQTSSIMVLVFMPHDVVRLQQPRLQQLNSRIDHRCDMQPSTLDDVALTCAQLSEVVIAPDLVAHIFEQTGASMRLVMNTIARLEGISASRPEAVRKTPMALADVAGMGLFKGLVAPGKKGAV